MHACASIPRLHYTHPAGVSLTRVVQCLRLRPARYSIGVGCFTPWLNHLCRFPFTLPSGKWPDDPTAFAKTKAALGLQLANALETAHGYKTIGSEECVDVLVDGYAFRLLFYSARDEAMLAKAQQPSQQPSQQAWQQASQQAQRAAGAAAGPGPGSAATAAAAGAGAGSTSRPPPVVRSWHHGLVSYVAGLNPAFAPTVRLAKRWLGCQLMSNQIGDEAAELLVAAVFAGSSALPSPGSRHSGKLLGLLGGRKECERLLVCPCEADLFDDSATWVPAERSCLHLFYAGHCLTALHLTKADLCSLALSH